jgi:hypothetical protein
MARFHLIAAHVHVFCFERCGIPRVCGGDGTLEEASVHIERLSGTPAKNRAKNT